MSLNNIRLTPHLLTGLYPDVLIETNATPVPALVESPAISFLGMNEKKILILSSVPDAVYLPEGELAFLATVLGACKLGIADVAIVNWLNTKKEAAPILDLLESRTVLLFDVSPLDFGLPFNFPPFQVQDFAGRTYLSAPSLQLIEGDKEAKKSLWNALKKLFSI
jgi:hypothetical protein